uniref:DUF4806 domain-containing protein n=1 Tax=Trichogramma kaykai TaxID=54128 RepID=A0ABD2W0S5_9HYME
MMTAYERIKKCRYMKKNSDKNNESIRSNDLSDEFNLSVNESIDNIMDINNINDDNDDDIMDCCENEELEKKIDSTNMDVTDSFYNLEFNELYYDNDIEVEHMEEMENDIANRTLREKLHKWAINNIFTLKNSVISELLVILREEGHSELPKTAETLLRTKQCAFDAKVMKSGRGNNGVYTYFGIEKALNKMIASSEFEDNEEETVNILVNVDGVPLYKNSSQQFWPILIQIIDNNYTCTPEVVALYWGDSKPSSVDEFMDDFIEEARKLREGFQCNDHNYSFNILGFTCDTPARAYLKCCKGHGGFYACERCEVKGKTIKGRRNYIEMNCKLRTKTSFIEKTQAEHHQPNIVSPLTKLPNFDPVKQVFLESMHLLYQGVMKMIISMFIEPGNNNKLSKNNRNDLKVELSRMSAGILVEFERKTFNLDNFGYWKATQFRFFAGYTAPFIFKKYVSIEKYQHLMLFLVSTRILNSKPLVEKYHAFAREYLRLFFELTPHVYGPGTQVMNFHNLIHVTDDVLEMKAPLSTFSAFPFENCLGKIKKLIRSSKNPLAQVTRRLHEIQELNNSLVTRNILKNQCLRITTREWKISQNDYEESSQIKLGNLVIKNKEPDNIVMLESGKFFEITNIYLDTGSMLVAGTIMRLSLRNELFTILGQYWIPMLSQH